MLSKLSRSLGACPKECHDVVHYTIGDDELAGYLLNWGFEDTIIINSGLPDFAVDLKVAIGGKENVRLHKKLSHR